MAAVNGQQSSVADVKVAEINGQQSSVADVKVAAANGQQSSVADVKVAAVNGQQSSIAVDELNVDKHNMAAAVAAGEFGMAAAVTADECGMAAAVAAGEHNMATAMVTSLLSEVDAAATALEVTMENEMLGGRVKQPAMDAVTDQYDYQLNNWKLQARSDGKQAVMEIMDAMSVMGKHTQQSMMDAVEKCEMAKQPVKDAVAVLKKNSWDTKRKNVQKARKRHRKSAKDGERI
jgi:hypothetical protein